GLGDFGHPHLVQEVVARALASQCGYCTPGVVMSLVEACYRQDLDEPWKLDAQMCGNLCRCTGYRPIREAASSVAGGQPPGRLLTALGATAEEPPRSLTYQHGRQRFFAPATLDELWSVLEANPGARFLAGGTDLGLEVTKRYVEHELLVSLESIDALNGL